jgi:hypothetical protein
MPAIFSSAEPGPQLMDTSWARTYQARDESEGGPFKGQTQVSSINDGL